MLIKLSATELSEFSELFVAEGCTTSGVVWTLNEQTGMLEVDKPQDLSRHLRGFIWDEDESGSDPDDIALIKKRNKAFNGIIRKLTRK